MKIRIVNISIGTLPHKKDPEDELFLFWVERLWDAGLVVVTAAGKQRTKGRERHDTGKQPEGDHSWGG